jgi:hypothetical protein
MKILQLTFQVKILKMYWLAMVARMLRAIVTTIRTGFKNRIKVLVMSGLNRFKRTPIDRSTNSPIAVPSMSKYGIRMLFWSSKFWPNVKIQKGMVPEKSKKEVEQEMILHHPVHSPNATKTLIVVIVTERFKLPSSR